MKDPHTGNPYAPYLRAVADNALSSVIIGGPMTIGFAYLLIQGVEASASAGGQVFVDELPGPFSWWGNLWLWGAIGGFVVNLPRALVKAPKQERRRRERRLKRIAAELPETGQPDATAFHYESKTLWKWDGQAWALVPREEWPERLRRQAEEGNL